MAAASPKNTPQSMSQLMSAFDIYMKSRGAGDLFLKKRIGGVFDTLDQVVSALSKNVNLMDFGVIQTKMDGVVTTVEKSFVPLTDLFKSYSGKFKQSFDRMLAQMNVGFNLSDIFGINLTPNRLGVAQNDGQLMLSELKSINVRLQQNTHDKQILDELVSINEGLREAKDKTVVENKKTKGFWGKLFEPKKKEEGLSSDGLIISGFGPDAQKYLRNIGRPGDKGDRTTFISTRVEKKDEEKESGGFFGFIGTVLKYLAIGGGAIYLVKKLLGDAKFDELWNEGRKMFDDVWNKFSPTVKAAFDDVWNSGAKMLSDGLDKSQEIFVDVFDAFDKSHVGQSLASFAGDPVRKLEAQEYLRDKEKEKEKNQSSGINRKILTASQSLEKMLPKIYEMNPDLNVEGNKAFARAQDLNQGGLLWSGTKQLFDRINPATTSVTELQNNQFAQNDTIAKMFTERHPEIFEKFQKLPYANNDISAFLTKYKAPLLDAGKLLADYNNDSFLDSEEKRSQMLNDYTKTMAGLSDMATDYMSKILKSEYGDDPTNSQKAPEPNKEIPYPQQMENLKKTNENMQKEKKALLDSVNDLNNKTHNEEKEKVEKGNELLENILTETSNTNAILMGQTNVSVELGKAQIQATASNRPQPPSKVNISQSHSSWRDLFRMQNINWA